MDLSPSSSSHDIKAAVARTYDAIAPQYLAWTSKAHSTRITYLQKLLAEILPTTKAKVLELGCGAGVPVTQLLASHQNIQVTANDISEAQLALAAQNLPQTAQVKLVKGDMMDLEFPDDEFDAVIGMYTVIHLPKDEQRVLAQRISRWLKKDGWLLVNFGAQENTGSVNKAWLGAKGGEMFWSGWGVEGSCNLVKEAGLEVRLSEITHDVEDEEGKGEKIVPFLWILAKKT